MSDQLPMTSQPYVASRDKQGGPWRAVAIGLGLATLAIGAALAFGASRLAEELEAEDREKAARAPGLDTPPTV